MMDDLFEEDKKIKSSQRKEVRYYVDMTYETMRIDT